MIIKNKLISFTLIFFFSFLIFLSCGDEDNNDVFVDLVDTPVPEFIPTFTPTPTPKPIPTYTATVIPSPTSTGTSTTTVLSSLPKAGSILYPAFSKGLINVEFTDNLILLI